MSRIDKERRENMHNLVEFYVMDALDPEENERFERHLHTCAWCQSKWEDAQRVTEGLLHLPTRREPPAYVRSRLLRGVSVPSGARRRKRGPWWFPYVAMILALMMPGGSWLAWMYAGEGIQTSAVDTVPFKMAQASPSETTDDRILLKIDRNRGNETPSDTTEEPDDKQQIEGKNRVAVSRPVTAPAMDRPSLPGDADVENPSPPAQSPSDPPDTNPPEPPDSDPPDNPPPPTAPDQPEEPSEPEKPQPPEEEQPALVAVEIGDCRIEVIDKDGLIDVEKRENRDTQLVPDPDPVEKEDPPNSDSVEKEDPATSDPVEKNPPAAPDPRYESDTKQTVSTE